MKNEMLLAVTQLAAERNLSHSVVVSAIKSALENAYKRDELAKGQDVKVDLNPTTGETVVRTVRRVVEVIENIDEEIALSEAQKQFKEVKVGDEITTGFIEHNPGRIAAQTAKQIVIQKLREAERELVLKEFSDKTGQILNGTIQRVDPKHVVISLGKGEGIMPITEQINGERYRVGQQLKFLVQRVENSVRGPEIILSRNDPGLLRELFKTEVPEIFNGVIEIKALSREAGSRSKIAVFSNQEGVDAVGACVGLRGLRIQNVVNELLGEKIDVVEWNEDDAEFIKKSLSPAEVQKVVLNEITGSSLVIVPEDQLSLAIGKDGQNVRLAAKLTEWKLDIQHQGSISSDQDFVELKLENSTSVSDLGFASRTEKLIVAEGIKTLGDLALKRESLLDVKGLGPKSLEEVNSVLKSFKGTPEKIKVDTKKDEKPNQNVQDTVLEGETENIKEESIDELNPEDEILELENLEKSQEKISENKIDTVQETVPQDDIWNIGKISRRKSSDSSQTLRFAEDIEGIRSSNESSTKKGKKERTKAKNRKGNSNKSR
ncbi:MAG: transcription termination/antitermination protein NusA [Dehalococcoidia bacterium]|nr:transcription termination/antitermination protein NusA [Dehalococcoidia bacterium]